MNIEETIFEDALPVNTLAMLDRMKEILKENQTNCASDLKGDGKLAYRKCLWLVNNQIRIVSPHSGEEWTELLRLEEKKLR